MSKYTPGPWRYSTAPQPNGCPIIGAGPLMVAMLAHTVNEPAQRETDHANARLIAAAPDLLESLQQLVAESVNPHDGSEYEDGEWIALDKARAAIAKATGE